MDEIKKIYLYTKVPLAPQQVEACLRDIAEQARQGFRIELQREVFAHTAEETFGFLVKRIEPPNKFYGLVDGDTEFEIMHEETKVSPPKMEKCKAMKIDPNSSLFIDETDQLKALIDNVAALSATHGVTYEFLYRLVGVMKDFGSQPGV